MLEFVDALVSQAVTVLRDHGLPEERARVAGTEIARRMCMQYGKTMLYVPSAMTWERNDRDQRMAHAYGQPGPAGVRPYTQARVEQLAVEANLTPQYVYQIIRVARAQTLLSGARGDAASAPATAAAEGCSLGPSRHRRARIER